MPIDEARIKEILERMDWPVQIAYEGNYTTWAIQEIYDANVHYSAPMYDFVGIRNDGKVIFHHEIAGETYIIDKDGTLLATLTDTFSPFPERVRQVSLCDKYILLFDTGYDDIVVQAGTTILWRCTVDDDKGGYTITGIEGCAISPSGEWIVVLVEESGTGNILIFIYKGS